MTDKETPPVATVAAGNRTATANRSPNYPQMGIKQAIERIQKIYEKEHTHSVPAQAAAEAMGYKSLSGTAKAGLSALRKFGLASATTEGYKVTSDAITILELPEDNPERKATIRRLGLRPTAFKQLFEKYGVTLPSDGTIRHFLIQNGYQLDGANQVIRFYKETLDFLSRMGPIVAEPDSKEGDVTEVQGNKKPAIDAGEGQTPKGSPPASQVTTGNLRFHVSPTCDAEVAFFGEVTTEAVSKLIQYLALSEDLYPSQARGKEKPAAATPFSEEEDIDIDNDSDEGFDELDDDVDDE